MYNIGGFLKRRSMMMRRQVLISLILVLGVITTACGMSQDEALSTLAMARTKTASSGAMTAAERAKANQPPTPGSGSGLDPTTTPMPSTIPESGDWVIDTNQIFENQAVVLNGNLRVASSGKLILRNADIKINNTSNGPYYIFVEVAGSLIIEDGSSISATSDSGRFSFIVNPYANFIMRNSELHGCGWGKPYESYGDTGGLTVYADNPILEGNLFSNNYNGVVLNGIANAQITNNQFLDNTWAGISIYGAHEATINGNSFKSSINGIWSGGGHHNTVTENTFSHHKEGGVFVFSGWNNEISGNTIEVDHPDYGGWVGIELDKVSGNNRVVDNTIIGGMNGIALHHSINNTIQGNTITRAQIGIELGYADDNLLADNVFTDIAPGFSYGAVIVYHSSGNQILNNKIGATGATPGLLLFGSSTNNTIQGNVVDASYRGLMLHQDANGNRVIGNTIHAGQEEAIVVNESSENVIHHNNFSGGQPPYDNGQNTWDDGSTGNYWEGNVGPGQYPITPGGLDRYPQVELLTIEPVPVTVLEDIEFINLPIRPAWVIRNETSIENQTITVENTLIVDSGGSLTLSNVTLLIGGGVDGGGITVRPGGALYIYNSIITPTEAGGGYLFQVQAGSTLVLKESTVQGVGYSWGTDWGGIYIATDGVIIEDTLISDTFRGLFIRSPAQGGHQINGNTIDGCYQAMTLMDQSHSSILNNQILNCIGWGIVVENGSNDVIADNRILNLWSWDGIGLSGESQTVVRNTVTSVGARRGMGLSGEGLVAEDNLILPSER
jgi:parallel beta-helix repeat protein